MQQPGTYRLVQATLIVPMDEALTVTSVHAAHANAAHLKHLRCTLAPMFKSFMLFHCNISFDNPCRIRLPLFRQP